MQTDQQTIQKPNIVNGVLIVALFVVALFFPSSKQSVISSSFELLIYIPLLLLLAVLLWRQPVYNTLNLILGATVVGSILVFTVTSSFMFNQISPGALPGYVGFVMVSLLNLQYEEYTGRLLRTTLLVVTIVQVILGIGIVTRDEDIRTIIIDNYSSGYDTLIPFMIDDLKPVTTFASHSVAGFYFFILFSLNLLSFTQTKRVIYLILSVLLMLLLVFIRSNTAYLYTAIAFLFLMISMRRRPGYLFLFLGFSVGVVSYVFIEFKDVIDLMLEYDLQRVTGHQGSGLVGRYTAGSYLEVTLNFIAKYPFFPIGLSYSDELFYTDSGIVIYYLRGSIFALFGIYLGYYHFLKRNLTWGNYFVWGVFGMYFLFEIGYPNLIIPRTIGSIPFIVLYLNHLKVNSILNES